MSDSKAVETASADVAPASESTGSPARTETRAATSGPALGARFLVPFAAVWLAVTLPILNLGYGSDTDSWLVARVAEIFWTTHSYAPSRSSGFPFFEMGVAPLVHTGHYWAANAFAFLGAINLFASLIFMAKRGKLRHPHLVLIFVAFLPVVLKNSTCTVDYMVTLSVISWAYVAMTYDRLVTTVLLVGLACGFRPQTILYFGPVCLYVLLTTRSFKKTFFLGLLGGVTAIVAYSPVLLTVGLRTGYKDYDLGVSGQILMFGYNGLQILGIVPSLVLAGLVAYIARQRKSGVVIGAKDIPHLPFHLAVFGVYGLAFAAMPHEPEYLLPAVLSLVYLLDALCDQRLMIAATITALSYHAFRIEAIGGTSAHRKFALSIGRGYLARDVAVRQFMLSTRDALTKFTPDRPTLFMFGSDWATPLNPAWEEVEKFAVYRKKGTDYYVADAFPEKSLEKWRAQGLRIVLWKGFAKDFLAFRPAADWQTRVDVIDSLDDYLGAKIEGQPMWPSE